MRWGKDSAICRGAEMNIRYFLGLLCLVSGCQLSPQLALRVGSTSTEGTNVQRAFSQLESDRIIAGVAEQKRLMFPRCPNTIFILGCTIQSGFNGHDLVDSRPISDVWCCYIFIGVGGSTLITNLRPAGITQLPSPLEGLLMIQVDPADTEIQRTAAECISKAAAGKYSSENNESWDGAELLEIGWIQNGKEYRVHEVNPELGVFVRDPNEPPRSDLEKTVRSILVLQTRIRDRWCFTE